MALQSIKHGFPFPMWPTATSGAPSLSGTTFVLDASGEKAAAIYMASAAKAIRKIHVRTGTVTTGDTVDARVETIDASGNPSGTLHTTDSNGAIVIADGDDDAWKSVQLTADTGALAIGDYFALVIVNGGGGGNMQINHYPDHSMLFPYGDLFTSSWTKTASPPLIIPEYSDGSFEPIFGVVDTGAPINTTTFNSGSTTNRCGNIFQVPFPCRAKGCWVWIDADGTYSVKLYDSDGSTVLATTITTTAAIRGNSTPLLKMLPFTATANLSAATNYRLAVVPATVTNLSTYDFDVPAAGVLDMFPGGQNCHASVFTSSAWVETTTRRGFLGVILDAFDDGAGSGTTTNFIFVPE